MDVKLSEIIEQFQNRIIRSVEDITAKHGDLVELLSLSEEYDNPESVLLAADLHSSIFGYYMMLFHQANKQLQKVETAYKIWRSKKERKLADILFNKNKKAGMTASNSKPTARDIENYFNERIYDTEKHQLWMKRLNKAKDNVSNLRIMRDTVESRKDMIKTISMLLSKSIESGFIVPSTKTRHRKSKTLIDDNIE